MEKKIASGTMLTLLLTSMLTLAFSIQPAKAEPTTWTVDDDGPADFHTIQEAINGATPEDTIYVHNGTYFEHLTIDKPLLLVGENNVTTIIDGNEVGTVVSISTNNVTIAGFTIRHSGLHEMGILADSGASECVVVNNIVIDNWFGIVLSASSYNVVARNRVEKNNGGIDLSGERCDNNLIVGNTVLDNEEGIYLSYSCGNVLRDNNMTSNTYGFGVLGDRLEEFMQDIDTSSTVDGKPVYYLMNQRDLTIDPSTLPDIGYLGIVNSTNITVRGVSLSNSIQGVLFAYTNSSRIENTETLHNGNGICLVHSNHNLIIGNTMEQNRDWGVLSIGSIENELYDNKVSRSLYGIELIESGCSILRNNEITSNTYNFGVGGSSLEDFLQDIDTTNTINGKPIAYLTNVNDREIQSEAGYVAAVNSTNVTIKGIDLESNIQGVLLAYTNQSRVEDSGVAETENGIVLLSSFRNEIQGNHVQGSFNGVFVHYSDSNVIDGNIIEDNARGIVVLSSNNNMIKENEIARNSMYGIHVLYSNKNVIFHNNFVANARQAYCSFFAENTWSDGYPSGGNYWSDYSGVDLYHGVGQDVPSRDGIGDTPYIIDSNNQDRYPLVDPWVERKVGVQVGDWVKYGDFVVEWSSNDPSANPPSDYDFWRSIEWTRTTVEAISDTTITFEFLIHFKDDTEQSSIWDIDIDTGVGFPFYFISADLAAGYTTYAGGVGYSPGPKINETIFAEYLGTLRETNHLNLSRFYEDYFGWKNYRESYNFYWDRATGVQTEYSYQRSFETGTEAYLTAELTCFRIVDTNLWGTPPAISAKLDINPDALNLRSKSKWITAYIQLPEGYSAADVNASTILLNGTIAPVLDQKYDFVTNSSEYLVDHNNDGILERIVKFDRAALQSWIYQSVGMQHEVSLTITGELTDGTLFEGTATILAFWQGRRSPSRR